MGRAAPAVEEAALALAEMLDAAEDPTSEARLLAVDWAAEELAAGSAEVIDSDWLAESLPPDPVSPCRLTTSTCVAGVSAVLRRWSGKEKYEQRQCAIVQEVCL